MQLAYLQIGAAIFWATINYVLVLFRVKLYMIEREKYHIAFGAGHLMAALWGTTIPLISEYHLKIFNGIVIPPLAGILFFIAHVMNINSKIK